MRPTKKRKRVHTVTMRCYKCDSVWGKRPDESDRCPKCGFSDKEEILRLKEVRNI